MTNDIVLLESTLAFVKKESQSKLKDDVFFELFCAEQVMKDFDLSYEELFGGLVGGGDDGGVDAIYVLVDSELIDEDTDLSEFKKTPQIDLYLIQAKQSPTFAETPFDRVLATSVEVFDLTRDVSTFRHCYNAELAKNLSVFRTSYVELAGRHAKLAIHYVYATKGDTQEIHPKVSAKAALLKKSLEQSFPGATVSTMFLGARELLSAAQKQKTYTLQLKLLENPISTGEGAYVALAALSDYGAFVMDEKGTLRKYIFESNVRDYQGDVDVNEDIRRTLEEKEPKLNFWWLNNGITILASRATIAGKTITLDDVQVVNGLQTTTSIYHHLKLHGVPSGARSLLVKIIETTDPEARDRIIKATNHQSAIPPASLKATDRIQRDIETYLLRHDWFYDRRKNFYKNQGKPLSRIIGIPYLAQAVMAVVLREPDNSRARPSTLIKREVDYQRVFNQAFDLELYRICIEIMKAVDSVVRYMVPSEGGASDEGRNFRFHVAMAFVMKLTKKRDYHVSDVLALNVQTEESQLLLEDSVLEVLETHEEVAANSHWSTDRIAKSREFAEELIETVTLGISEHTKRREEELKRMEEEMKKQIPEDDIPF